MVHIAHIYNNFTDKFGIPRQSGLVRDSFSRIVFEPEFRNPDALRGLEDFSHIWLIWEFSEAKRRNVRTGSGRDAVGTDWSPTVRPPRLGGNERMGVFATRSPFRPNPIGLSCVKIEKIEPHSDEGPVISVSGADLMNGTPIFDIKPYIPYADSYPDALAGFTGTREFPTVKVEIDDAVAGKLSARELAELKEVLACDPRPAYKRGENRTYRFGFAGREIEFEAEEGKIRVTGIDPYV